MRDRGGRRVTPSKKTLRDVYHLPAYGYKDHLGFNPKGAVRAGQSLLEALQLGGAAHPLRRAQAIAHGKGGPMIFPLGGKGPKLPDFMVTPARGTVTPGSAEARANLFELLQDTADHGIPIRHDKAIGHMRPTSNVEGLTGNANLFDHLAALQNLEANRAFVEWMMQHHYRRPN